MRLLLPQGRCGEVVGPDPDEAVLRGLYAYPAARWRRANMVSTLDGAATGPDGLAGSLSGGADRRVFAVLRTLADVVLVGAGTVRAEGYGPEAPPPPFAARREAEGRRPAPPFAVVTRSGDVPTGTGLFDGDAGTMVVTCASAGAATLQRLRDVAGAEHVVVAGDETVDLPAALQALAERGLGRVLCEGGPHLLAAVAGAGLLDELCLTTAPSVAAGSALRILDGPALPGGGLPAVPAHLLHEDGALLGRWTVTGTSA